MDQLTASLLDLLYELEGRGIPITVGGGFGLYLKRRHLEDVGTRTLFDQLPQPRATRDLDLFLIAEILVNLGRTQEVVEAIRRLGYTVVDTAKFLQWKREFVIDGISQEVKIDFLVGPLGDLRNKLNVNMPRVRPKGSIEFHAHAVEEAISIEDRPLPLAVPGKRSCGEPYEGTVFIPQAFPYLMMKLHAFEDRENKREEDKARHHALDLYTVVGLMTEQEYEWAKELGWSTPEINTSPEPTRSFGIISEASWRSGCYACGNTSCFARISGWTNS